WLQEHRPRLLHAFAEGETRRHLERHLARIHFVIAAVEDCYLDVDHGISGEKSASSRLANALLNRRDVLTWNCAAEDVVFKHHAASAGQRLHANLAVAVL